MAGLRHVALVSLEVWDQVWRRNQHLAAGLIASGAVERVTFIEPPVPSPRTAEPRLVAPGVTAVQPVLRVPKRLGGLAACGRQLRRGVLADLDVLWVNDATLGVRCLGSGLPAVHDVTDDWRTFDFPPRIRRRLVRAEDSLATRARTVVCSEVLRDRWHERYGVDADVVHNGVDAAAWHDAVARALPGPAPHVGYVGTLHEQRLDVDLVLAVADDPAVGTVHLVGPDALGETARRRLVAHPRLRLHGPVAAADVPSWTVSLDVLLSPHLVTPFTLSLDAIKSYEYLASGRPVVATPTSGFQSLHAETLAVAAAGDFVAAVRTALAAPTGARPDPGPWSWTARTAEFAAVLHDVAGRARATT